jgi:hypothetical protein
MIIDLFLLLSLFISVCIIINKGFSRLLWFLVGICFIRNIDIITSPGISVDRFLLVSFIFSVLIRWKSFLINWRCLPLKNFLLVIFSTLLIIGISDQRSLLFYKFYKPSVSYLETYLPLFLGFVSLEKTFDIQKVKKTILLIALVFSIYGIIIYILNYNPYDQLLASVLPDYVFDFVPQSDSNRGLRLNSFFSDSHVYGSVLSAFTLYLVGFFVRDKKMRLFLFSCIVLMVINLYLTKSRSSQVCFFGGIIIFLTFYLKHFKHRFWLYTSLFLLLLIHFIRH